MENIEISFLGWLGVFGAIVFLRNFLENFSGQRFDHQLNDFFTYFIHYPLAYLALLLSLIVGLYLITKEKITKILKFGLLGFAIIWLAPIIDLVITGGRGWAISYNFSGWQSFVYDFLTLGGAWRNPGVTPGVRMEVIAIIIGLALYAYIKTAKVGRAIIAGLGAYLIIFFYYCLPLIIVTVANWFRGSFINIDRGAMMDFFTKDVLNSGLFFGRTLGFGSQMKILPEALAKNFETIFNLQISAVYSIIIVALGIAIFKFYKPKAFWPVIGNIRPMRLGHYLVMAVLGVYLGYLYQGKWIIQSNYDYLMLILIFVAVAFAWIGAVFANDLADERIDSVTNSKRPLASGIISGKEARIIIWASFSVALASALIVGYYALVFMLAVIVISCVYSLPPLRLKRFPLLNTLLIALVSLVVSMTTFYLAAGTEDLNQYPIKIAVILLVCITLAFGVKDIKDLAGDKREGIKTLPVIFGEKDGKKVLGLMTLVAFLLIPILFRDFRVLILSIIFGAVIYSFINSKKINEKYILGAYFLYLISIAPLITISQIFK